MAGDDDDAVDYSGDLKMLHTQAYTLPHAIVCTVINWQCVFFSHLKLPRFRRQVHILENAIRNDISKCFWCKLN